MSDQPTYTPEQEAQITRRIGQAFDFLSDVLADPAILDDIPTGATLRFSEVKIGAVTFHLTAYPVRPTEFAPAHWMAHVTSPAEWAAEGRKSGGRPRGSGGRWNGSPTNPEYGRTAEEALAALEEKLRDSARLFETGRSGQEGYRIA